MAPFLQASLPYSIAGSRRAFVDVRRITDLPAREPRDENHKAYVMELFIAQRARGNCKPCPCNSSNSRVIYFPPQLTFTMEKYDLIVISSGPAGQRAAIQAAKFGKRVALVEKLEVVGGTAINTGTIPSKTIREAVLHLSGFYYQNIYGVNYRVKDQISMADLSFRAQHVIKTEIDVIRAQLSRNGIEVLTGLAS